MKYIQLIISCLIALMLFTIVKDRPQPRKTIETSKVSYDHLMNHRYDAIISQATLMSMGMVQKDIFQPLSELFKTRYKDTSAMRYGTLEILISSPGGSTDAGFELIKGMEYLKKVSKMRVICYVEQASSIAFTVMMGICDKRIALGTPTLIVHRAAMVDRSSHMYTVMSSLIDLRMAGIEVAHMTNMRIKQWLKMTRQPNVDRRLTKEEMKKYDIIQEFRKLD